MPSRAPKSPAAWIAKEQCLTLSGEPQATALGTSHRLRVTDAALDHGIACHALDFDDTQVPTILHPTTPLSAAGTPLGLTGAAATHCLGIAATQAAGHREQFGTMTKPFPQAMQRPWAYGQGCSPPGASPAHSSRCRADARMFAVMSSTSTR